MTSSGTAPSATIAILGRSQDTVNYENALRRLKLSCFTTLNPGEAAAATHLLLPGGGDITPAFFGQANRGSRGIHRTGYSADAGAGSLCAQRPADPRHL